MRRHRGHPPLPAAGPERERLRQKGQFWTPDWIARAMVEYVIADGPSQIYDPAVGSGALFRAARSIASERKLSLNLAGAEIDQAVLSQARDAGTADGDLARVEKRDFVLDPPEMALPAIVANPPYIRHHRLDATTKMALRTLAVRILGVPLDGRAGFHVYFLLRALERLAPDGRLAFILPADTFEGVFAQGLWDWIVRNYRLEVVVSFAPDASPFPGVDTNPLVVLLRRATPMSAFRWVCCHRPEDTTLAAWARSGFDDTTAGPDLELGVRSVEEAVGTGLSRRPWNPESEFVPLGHFVSVMRGIVTGANDFFFLTGRQVAGYGLPREFLLRAVGRTRDVDGDIIRDADLERWEASGRPSWLLVPDGRVLNGFPPSLRTYLEHGEAMGLPGRPIFRARSPWYKMEHRPTPPFLFAYLGRRDARFIRNPAGVVPLTCFLCVYPRDERPEAQERLWRVLRHPDTVANLRLVGKSYGEGAIKVEPRALERLPIPRRVIEESGLMVSEDVILTSHRRFHGPKPAQQAFPF